MNELDEDNQSTSNEVSKLIKSFSHFDSSSNSIINLHNDDMINQLNF